MPRTESVVDELFAEAQAQRSIGEHRKAVVKPRRRHTYALSSLIYCGSCNRRMSGAWNHGQAHYRCGFKTEYAGATGKHAKWVYLREADITGRLDESLLRHFDPENMEATIAALTDAQGPDDAVLARQEAARRTMADCDKRLAKYRRALEEGVEPKVVATWTQEVEALRLTAERDLREATPGAVLTEAEVRALVTAVHSGLIGLRGASAEQRAAIYGAMGLRLTYHVDRAKVVVEARPDACTQVCVGGGT
ncbi:MAG TPA: zinc ribbon domain-containing protein [Acidimicrobiales bacterium]|nr:zinc ribbon domain-containing protein [Acidimicrobiales bacterium]